MILKGLIIILAVAISIRDILHYKIPNMLLILMIIAKSSDIMLGILSEEQGIWILLSAFAGAAAGFIIFFSASKMGYILGAGDIKYSVVAGYVLGFGGYLWAMLIAGGTALCFFAFMRKVRRMYLNVTIPLAPFISAGLIIMLLI